MKKSKIILFLSISALLLASLIGLGPRTLKNLNLGLDLQGGFEIVYEISPLTEGGQLPDLAAVSTAVNNRINVLGVNEPYLSIEGDNRIRVQLAGIKDLQEARKTISTTANLTFRDVNDKLLMDATSIRQGGAGLSFPNGRPAVNLAINDQDKFAAITRELSTKPQGENLIVAWLDFKDGVDSYAVEAKKKTPKFISAASVRTEIRGNAVIEGNFTTEEARNLANLINAGSLPVKMTEIYSNVVSASYGENAFKATMLAGLVGILAVIIFMIAYYRIMGVVSAITLGFYALFVMFIYTLMGGVFTLSGIAALVLGVGMTVDANVLAFERIKDSLYAGRSVRSAFKEGTSKSFTSIFDSQLTTLLAGLILYILGTGTIKGFATMLIVTVLTTFLINVWLANGLLKLLVDSKYLDDKKSWFGVKQEFIPDLSKGEEQKYFGRLGKWDFVKNSKFFIRGSIVVIVLGVVMMGFNLAKGNNALNLGIDFTSGSKITVNSDSEIKEDTLVPIFTQYGYTPKQIILGGDNKNVATVSFTESITQDDLDGIKSKLKEVYKEEANDSVVTPVVGRELAFSAFKISLISWIAILLYITLRYRFDYAISGIVTLLHDVLFVIAIFSILRLEINIDFIAVILAIIGYSINDTIVIFDRIRESLGLYKHQEVTQEMYVQIVNESLQKVFTRSIINTFTTILPVMFLIFMGSASIFLFNFAMFIGLAVGAYSSIFIAAQLWLFIRKHRPHKPKAKKRRQSVDEVEEMVIVGIND